MGKALTVLLLVLFPLGAGASQSLLSQYDLYQMGDSEAVLELSGQELPRPEWSFRGGKGRFVFANTRVGPNMKEARPMPYPLISGMEIRQVSQDAVIEVSAAVPLQIRAAYGEAPASRFTFRMSAGEDRAAGPAAVPQEEDRLPGTEEKVDLDLRDIELRDLLRVLGARLGKNIILDTSLPSARVTMTLKGGPLEEVLNYLMRAYGLAFRSMGENTLVIGTREGLARLSGPDEARVFDIAYADPAMVQGVLVSLTGLQASRVVVDPRLRSLYVTANPQKLSEVERLIESLDRAGRQVMIRARIFQYTDGAARDVETALNAVYNHWWFSYSGQGGGRGGYIWDNGQGRAFEAPSSGYPLPGMTTLETPMEGIWREFDAAFSAIETKGRGKTLANPSVIVLDGQEAKIELTEDYPYISSRDDAKNPTWSTRTVGPQMVLTPRVGRDGFLTLQAHIETGEVLEMITGSTGERMPRTAKRSVTTQIRVRDGEPFVVGGLFQDNQTRRRAKMPILGQIPLLGELFAYRYDERNRTQVVILVVPYIL